MSDDTERRWLVVGRGTGYHSDDGCAWIGESHAWVAPMTRDEADALAARVPGGRVVEAPGVDPDATAEPHDCRCPSRYRFDTGAIVRCTQWAGHHDSDGPYDTPHNWEGRRWTDDEAYVAPPSVKEKVLAVLNRESVSEVTFRKELARRIAAAIEDGDDG